MTGAPAPVVSGVHPGPRLVQISNPVEGWERWFRVRCGDLDANLARRVLAVLLRVDAGFQDLWTDGRRWLLRQGFGPVQYAILTTHALLIIAPDDVAAMFALVVQPSRARSLRHPLIARSQREARRPSPCIEDLPPIKTGDCA